METVILTNMCMVYDENEKVLVHNKIGNTSWCGLTFPGWHIEKNESLVDSVIRGVYEETGLSIENPILCGSKDWINSDGSRYLVLFFKANKYSGKIKSSSEGEMKWMTLEDMKNGKWWSTWIKWLTFLLTIL